MTDVTLTYYTFGADHLLPDGTPAKDAYVIVMLDTFTATHVDPRVLFMAWLGSNRFAFEYGEDEWAEGTSKHYRGVYPAAILSVSAASPKGNISLMPEPMESVQCREGWHLLCGMLTCGCICHEEEK